MICDKQRNFVALYRSPSQDQGEFDSFLKNLEITLDKLALNNPFMLVVIGDLNAKSKNWHPSDRTTYEGNIIETITSHFGLHQLIHDPTHILGKSSSCIDLIFTSQPNMAVNSGVHSSFHANCLIRRAIHEFNWKRALSNLNVDEQVTVFNRTILNIMKNFIPHETIVCDDKDPPWFNKRIKSLIQEGALLLETFRKNRNNVEIITCLNNFNDRSALLINTAK